MRLVPLPLLSAVALTSGDSNRLLWSCTERRLTLARTSLVLVSSFCSVFMSILPTCFSYDCQSVMRDGEPLFHQPTCFPTTATHFV